MNETQRLRNEARKIARELTDQGRQKVVWEALKDLEVSRIEDLETEGDFEDFIDVVKWLAISDTPKNERQIQIPAAGGTREECIRLAIPYAEKWFGTESIKMVSEEVSTMKLLSVDGTTISIRFEATFTFEEVET